MSWKVLHQQLGSFRHWFPIDTPTHGEALVCVPPKSGWTSFRYVIAPDTIGKSFSGYMTSIGRQPLYPHQAMHRDLPKFLAVRHPLDRYRSLCRAVMAAPSWAIKQLIPPEYRDPYALMDYIEASPLGNVHWYPQHGYLVRGARIIRFDELLQRLGYPPAWENRGADIALDVDDARVLRHYQHDLTLWERHERQ